MLFALPQGSSKSAMMAHSSTGGNTNNASTGNQKSNGKVQNGIRAGRNRKRSHAAMSFSHGAVVALFLLLLLVVTIFSPAGGAAVLRLTQTQRRTKGLRRFTAGTTRCRWRPMERRKRWPITRWKYATHKKKRLTFFLSLRNQTVRLRTSTNYTPDARKTNTAVCVSVETEMWNV